MTPRLLPAATACLLALTLAGCSDEPDTDAGPDGGATSAATIPAGWTTHEGEGFTLAAPSDYELLELESGNGEPMLVVEKETDIPNVPQRVAVVRDVDPRSDVESQSQVLAEIESTGRHEGAVTREEVEAPGGGTAYLVTWTHELTIDGGGTATVRYEQLMHQVSDDLILNVVAFAPAGVFEDSEVSAIAETYAPVA